MKQDDDGHARPLSDREKTVAVVVCVVVAVLLFLGFFFVTEYRLDGPPIHSEWRTRTISIDDNCAYKTVIEVGESGFIYRNETVPLEEKERLECTNASMLRIVYRLNNNSIDFDYVHIWRKETSNQSYQNGIKGDLK